MSGAVLITGVHTGIGAALAASFLDSGVRVFGMSRREPASLAGRDGFSFAPVDLSETESIAPAVAALVPSGVELSLAVLNAGVLGEIRNWSEQSLDEIRRVMTVNVWANKELIEAVTAPPRALRQVVGISSGAAVHCSGGWGPYSVSKAALNAMLKSYAEEKPGTHFSALAPGVVRTPMVETVLAIEGERKHSATERVQSLEGTARLQSVEDAVGRLRRAFVKLLDEPSGSFLDLREMAL